MSRSSKLMLLFLQCVRHATNLPLCKEAQDGHKKILISVINQHEAMLIYQMDQKSKKIWKPIVRLLPSIVLWFVRNIETWKVYWKQKMTDEAMIVMRKLHMVLLSRWTKNISLKINNGVQHHWSINEINNK
jgi:hypothetical protein